MLHTNQILKSFDPIADFNSTVLILGTMPGALSLKENQYYAHPLNLFWKIMYTLMQQEYSRVYHQRVQLLKAHQIALWDVLKYCDREGSLDSNIKNEFPNDFMGFFEKHKRIKHVIFNGQPAKKYFKKYVGFDPKYNYHLMPSTSPSYASKNFDYKLQEWKLILEILGI